MEYEIKILDEQFFISEKLLVECGINEKSLANHFSRNKTGKSIRFSFFKSTNSNEKWVLYKTIPHKILNKLSLPIDEKQLIYTLKSHSRFEQVLNKKLKEIDFILTNAWCNQLYWKQYIPFYNEFYLDFEKRVLFAKTHSVFAEVIQLKKMKQFSLKDIHLMYLKIEKTLFWTKSYKSFSKKIRKAEVNGIPETIVHDFKRFGRNNYKLTLMVERRIVFYYSNPKRYSINQITYKVNDELVSRGLSTISCSVVKLFLQNFSVKNTCAISRYGNKYAEEKLFPYLRREEPKHIGELFQIDSTRLNFPYLDEDRNEKFLNLCVMMDVYTRKIIGYSMSESENYVMILECFKRAFETFKYIPNQIVCDNHASYRSSEFKKFNQNLDDLGVCLRRASPENAKDKGQIERWFRIFTTKYLNQVVGSLGDGIRTRVEGGRASRDLEKIYRNFAYLRPKKKLCQLIVILIKKYNKDISMQNDIPPKIDNLRRFEPSDIAKLFFKKKNRKVRRSMIHLQIKNKKYTYTIKNILLANKINRTFIDVRFDEDNPEFIYMFNPRSSKYLGCLNADELISIVPDEKQLHIIEKHNNQLRKRVQSTFDNLVSEIDNGKLELESLPITQVFNSEESLQSVLSQAEDNLLLGEIINNNRQIVKSKKDRKTDTKKKHLTSLYLRKIKSRKIEIIKT